MKQYAKFDLTTGEILATGVCLDDEFAEDPDVITWDTDDIVRGKDHYVLLPEKTITPKTPLPVTWDKLTIVGDGVDTATLSGLPIPCKAFIDGEAMVIEDGELQFTSSTIGQYQVWIVSAPYLQGRWVLEAI
jgi:hypothetical protein